MMLELNPGREAEVLSQSVTPEVAAANPAVQALIKPRIQTLAGISKSILLTVISSIQSIPYGIRWICKQIKYLTKVSLVIRWKDRLND